MKEFISFDTYAKDAIKLADMIKKTGRTFRSIIVITRGGLFPATILSAQLNIKKIDTYCLASYANKIGGEIQELKKPVIDTEDALLSMIFLTLAILRDMLNLCFQMLSLPVYM